MNDTLPVPLVARRLVQNLATRDQLIDLLTEVVGAYRFTNRLDEAVCLLPADVMDQIAAITGLELHPIDELEDQP